MLLSLEINCGERSFWFQMILYLWVSGRLPVSLLNIFIKLPWGRSSLKWSPALVHLCEAHCFMDQRSYLMGFWHFKKSKLTQNILRSLHNQPVPEWYSNGSMGLFALCPLSVLFCDIALNYEVITPEILGRLGTSL